jgi:hypothetical protein
MRVAGRRGLAPLELVLWLPILLFVAALMVNLGTMTAWRMRGEIVAHDAAWRVRWPRTGEDEPRPIERVWPADAAMLVEGEDDGVVQIEALDDPAIDLPVVRGPLPNGFEVRQIFEPDQGAYRGVSEIERDFPLLPRLGPFESGRIHHPLLDRRYSVAEIGMARNVQRRTLVLYDLPETDPSLPQAFIDTITEMLANVDAEGLRVLDRDPDVIRYRGGRDFHPRINRNRCTLDRDEVHEEEVERLVDHLDEEGEIELGEISHLPRTMTRFFLGMYRSVLDQMDENDPDRARIEEYVDQLEAYMSRMRAIESRLRQAYAATL